MLMGEQVSLARGVIFDDRRQEEAGRKATDDAPNLVVVEVVRAPPQRWMPRVPDEQFSPSKYLRRKLLGRYDWATEPMDWLGHGAE